MLDFHIALSPEKFEEDATNLLRRFEKGENICIVEDRPIFSLIILLTAQFDLERQAERRLALTRERVSLAIEAYRSDERPGVRTYLAGWVSQ